MDDRLVSKDLVYDGRIATGYKLRLRMGDGHVVERDYFHYNGAVVILPVLDDGRIVLIRNYRFAVDERLWELPAGMLEADEDPADCAARELAEETGHAAGAITRLGQFYSAPGTMDEVMHAYLATDLTAGPQNLERYEEITVEPQTEADVRGMIESGEIHDGKTLAALGLYWLKR
ncbi:MAG: NUDIX hydrolase [Phycisphaerae bacterium]|nr:NUDIX hydrolase [Phycisphaerae bacterium]